MPRPIIKPTTPEARKKFMEDLADEMRSAYIKMFFQDNDGTATNRHTVHDQEARDLFITYYPEGSYEYYPFSGPLKPEVTQEQAREILADADLLTLFLIAFKEVGGYSAVTTMQSAIAVKTLYERAGVGPYTHGIHGNTCPLGYPKGLVQTNSEAYLEEFRKIQTREASLPFAQREADGADKEAFLLKASLELGIPLHNMCFLDDAEQATRNFLTRNGGLSFGGRGELEPIRGGEEPEYYTAAAIKAGLTIDAFMHLRAKVQERLELLEIDPSYRDGPAKPALSLQDLEAENKRVSDILTGRKKFEELKELLSGVRGSSQTGGEEEVAPPPLPVRPKFLGPAGPSSADAPQLPERVRAPTMAAPAPAHKLPSHLSQESSPKSDAAFYGFEDSLRKLGPNPNKAGLGDLIKAFAADASLLFSARQSIGISLLNSTLNSIDSTPIDVTSIANIQGLLEAFKSKGSPFSESVFERKINDPAFGLNDGQKDQLTGLLIQSKESVSAPKLPPKTYVAQDPSAPALPPGRGTISAATAPNAAETPLSTVKLNSQEVASAMLAAIQLQRGGGGGGGRGGRGEDEEPEDTRF